MTNEEWLKSLPTEKFAEQYYRVRAKFCEKLVGICMKNEYGTECLSCFIAWLKQEHKEKIKMQGLGRASLIK